MSVKIILIVLLVVVGFIGLGIFGLVLGWFGEATQVAQEEFGPRAMLQKYEWFKDVAAVLEKSKLTLRFFKTELTLFPA